MSLATRIANLERNAGTTGDGRTVYAVEDRSEDGRELVRTWILGGRRGEQAKAIPAGEPLPENLVVVQRLRGISLGDI